MGIDLRFPNISGTSPSQKMAEMQSYLHQLVQQLNWALNNIDNAAEGKSSAVVMSKEPDSASEAVETFNSIKSLIIKSADIVKAYETTIKKTFDGEYVAISDFGQYKQDTNLSIETNSKNITEAFTNIESIGDNIRETNAYIQRGLLGPDKDGNPVYGLSVGETDSNGVYKKYAWFTANKLSFFDGNGNEVAYISSNTLYITDAVFLGKVQFGGYKADTSDGLAFTWIGG